jgi:Protein of unknown function (DUF2934)
VAIKYMYFVQDDPTDASPSAAATRSRQAEIARMAYLLSEARGFAPGHELEDWLMAEREIDVDRADAIHRRSKAEPRLSNGL